MPEKLRSDFLEHFRYDNDHTLVGFAVLGGIFAEGIDLVGTRLTGAVIIGVGLPGITWERELIRRYYDEDEQGFTFAYQYPGMIRVLQAAGRVIRSQFDRGALLLIDKRFEHFTYKKLLPQEWLLQRVGHHQQIQELITRFWKQEDFYIPLR